MVREYVGVQRTHMDSEEQAVFSKARLVLTNEDWSGIDTLLAARPDLFDIGGLTRALKGFLGEASGLPDMSTTASDVVVEVSPEVSRTESWRPHIRCAVVRAFRGASRRGSSRPRQTGPGCWAPTAVCSCRRR